MPLSYGIVIIYPFAFLELFNDENRNLNIFHPQCQKIPL